MKFFFSFLALCSLGLCSLHAGSPKLIHPKRKKSFSNYALVIVPSSCGPAAIIPSPKGELDFRTAWFEASVLNVDGFRGILPFQRLNYESYLTPDVNFRWSAQQIIRSNRRLAQPICTPVRGCPDIRNISIIGD